MISAPRSMPTRSTRKSISSPGSTMPRKRDVQPTRRAGGVALSVGRGHDVLRGGRQPHAVHDGRFQPGEQSGGTVGVDRVVITGHHGERAHVGRRGDGDVAAATARRVGGVVGDRPACARRIGQFDGAGAAADREPLLELRQLGAFGVADGHRHRDDAADLGVDRGRSRCGDGQFGTASSASGRAGAPRGRGAPGSADPRRPGSRRR